MCLPQAHSSPAEGVIGSFDTDLSDGFIACVRVATQALLQHRPKLLFPHPLAPTRQRRAVEHQCILEKLLAAEVLEVRVLHPALAQNLVGEVVGVCLGIVSPAISRVGNGGWPGLSMYAAPNVSSRKCPSIARASFTNAWFVSMIWSSRERNRSCPPLSRCYADSAHLGHRSLSSSAAAPASIDELDDRGLGEGGRRFHSTWSSRPHFQPDADLSGKVSYEVNVGPPRALDHRVAERGRARRGRKGNVGAESLNVTPAARPSSAGAFGGEARGHHHFC
jgi:hypothetical protein